MILELLREDEEFRLAVAGLLGLDSILRELRALREDFNRAVERFDRRFEAIERKLLEHDKLFAEAFKRFEAIERKLLEHDKLFQRILEEIARIWEEIRRLWKAVESLNRRVSRLEDLMGAMAESMYSKFTLEVIMEEARAGGERVLRWERNARVDGEDVDLLVETEGRVYVVEVKVQPRIADVGALLAKAEVASRVFRGKEVVPVLTGTRIGREVSDYAVSRGVRVFGW